MKTISILISFLFMLDCSSINVIGKDSGKSLKAPQEANKVIAYFKADIDSSSPKKSDFTFNFFDLLSGSPSYQSFTLEDENPSVNKNGNKQFSKCYVMELKSTFYSLTTIEYGSTEWDTSKLSNNPNFLTIDLKNDNKVWYLGTLNFEFNKTLPKFINKVGKEECDKELTSIFPNIDFPNAKSTEEPKPKVEKKETKK